MASRNEPSSSSSREIDESLYSRQLYVLGHEAMRRMANSDVLISGLGGLGVEVAKNVILSGVKSVTLHDEVLCQMSDLTSQFYLNESDLGKFRAERCLPQLAELNGYVQTQSYTGPLTDDFIRSFSVVVLADSAAEDRLWISEFTHANDIALVLAESRGLFASVFCDFGEEFTVYDNNGENPISAMISCITSHKEGIVTCLDDTVHGFEDGDYVTFSEVKGMKELNGCQPKSIRVLGPYTFSIGDTSGYDKYTQGGIVTQVKIPKVLNFRRLRDAIMDPEFVISDFGKLERPEQLHLAFQTLHRYEATKGELPKPWCRKSSSVFLSLARTIGLADGQNKTIDVDLMDIFSKTCRGSLSPMNATMGGVVAQEVLKACSGKFTPIHQWLYFDAVECLPTVLKHLNEEECSARNSRYDGQTVVFGNAFQERLASMKYFVIGAGAVGCELLKNLAMMGVGTIDDGSVSVADMDLIERSNLNRQFLFRLSDLRKSKSKTAAREVRNMNPTMNVIAYEDRVGPESENFFNDEFYDALDGVATALDNVEARIYVDRRCVYHCKPMLESGTLGTKGNTQVVIPFITESYTSSQDAPEKGIPICTLKNFPNAIEHTLQWARDLFEGVFHQAPENAVHYLKERGFMERIHSLPVHQSIEFMESLKMSLVDQRPKTFEDCVTWARCYWEEQFNNQIQQLLFNFPEDQLTSSGQPFWSGPKRCPLPLTFSTDNSLHVDFVLAAANLKAQVYDIKQNRDRDAIVKMLKNVSVPVFTPRSGVNIAQSDSLQMPLNDTATSATSERLAILQQELPTKGQLASLHVTPLEFEKDDDTNLHVDFIVAASNLRADNYRIANADRHKSKMIAGKIIPAIATTTSVVAGLACLELYKLAQGHQNLALFKNGFVNLALPFFAFSEPLAARKYTYNGRAWTLWDRFDVTGEMTLREFLKYFKNNHNLEVTILTEGVCMLYSGFLSKEKCDARMDQPLSVLVETVSKKRIEPHVKTLIFEIGCNDSTGDDVEVPYVRYSLPR